MENIIAVPCHLTDESSQLIANVTKTLRESHELLISCSAACGYLFFHPKFPQSMPLISGKISFIFFSVMKSLEGLFCFAYKILNKLIIFKTI